MRTKPTPASHRHLFAVWLGRLWQALLAPTAALDDVALRHKSRLLAILLLTLIALFGLAVIDGCAEGFSKLIVARLRK